MVWPPSDFPEGLPRRCCTEAKEDRPLVEQSQGAPSCPRPCFLGDLAAEINEKGRQRWAEHRSREVRQASERGPPQNVDTVTAGWN